MSVFSLSPQFIPDIVKTHKSYQEIKEEVPRGQTSSRLSEGNQNRTLGLEVQKVTRRNPCWGMGEPL